MAAPRQSILLYNNFLIEQIIVSCRGNIGSCVIYCAIVTIDGQSYCTVSPRLSLLLSQKIPKVLFILSVYYLNFNTIEIYTSICYIIYYTTLCSPGGWLRNIPSVGLQYCSGEVTFYTSIYTFNNFTNIPMLVLQVVNINIAHVVAERHTSTSSEQYWKRAEGYWAINPLDYTMLPWLCNILSTFSKSRNILYNLSVLPLHT